jgi:GT2 family glycosyltransferase
VSAAQPAQPPGAQVTVAIVTFRSRADLPNCLTSLLASTVPVKAVIIDNASGDGTLEMAQDFARQHPNVVALDSGGNIGLAAGNNLVIPHIEGEYVLILNPDTVVRPDTLSLLIQRMKENPRVGIIGPKNLYADGSPHTSYHLSWNLGHLILWRVFPYSFMRRLYDTYARYRESDVYYVSGACLLVRADVFREIGGYDPRYFLSAEDTCDLCRRVAARGYRILYSPSAVITHLSGRSGEQVPYLATMESYKGSIYYFSKFAGAMGGMLAFAIIVFACLTRIVTSILKLALRRRPADRANLRVFWSILPKLLARGPRIAYSDER